MMDIATTEAVGLLIAAAAGVGVIGAGVVLLLNRNRKSVPPADPDLIGRLDSVQSALDSRHGSLDAQVAQLDSKLAALQESVTAREATIEVQMRGIGAQVQGITALFTNDRARGGWAEIGLKRIFEQGGLVEGRDFTCQISTGEVKPDAVVHLPGGRNIVIDAKFPIARYNEALAEADPDRRLRLLAEQGKELERVGRSLAGKGYAELATGGYVVMYLPSQAVYEAAAAAHPELIDRLMGSRVIVAGPSALYALLLSVGSLVTEFQALQQADRILDDARELHRRMSTFVGHLQSVGTGLTNAVRAYNGAIGSWGSRVAPQLARLGEQTGRGEIESPAPVEEALRPAEPGLRVAG